MSVGQERDKHDLVERIRSLMKTKVKVAVIGAMAIVIAAIIQGKYNENIHTQNIDNQNSPVINVSISNNNIINTEPDDKLYDMNEEAVYDDPLLESYDSSDSDGISLITVKVREYNGKDTDWKDNIKIEKSQQIEFLIKYRNIKSYKQENVLISDILPENVKYIHGTAKMHNNVYPDGIKINSDELFSDQGFNIGDYEPKTVSTINFCVEVFDIDLVDGMRTLTNTVRCLVGADKESVTEDYAYKAIAGWGPERKLYTNQNPAEYPVFNSITDNAAVGDERDFVRIVEKSSGRVYSSDIEVEANKQYEVYIYYHNNASATYNDKAHDYVGVARNVRLASNFPKSLVVGEHGVVSAKISASNTDPGVIWDGACVTAKEDITLHYVTGSAKIYNQWETNGNTLSTHMFSDEGTFIGLDQLNGVILGCDEYSGHVVYTIQTRALQENT